VKLLDLFCCQGGAGEGYRRAGFDILGVDINPQPNNPHPFIQADALEFARERGHEFDVWHGSPPCQAYTTMSNRHRGQGGKADSWPKLIEPLRELAIASGKPYVIENVVGARSALIAPVTLHGGMFGLGVHRPRLFESNIPLFSEKAPQVKNPVGVYGKAPDGRHLFTRADGTRQLAASSAEEAGLAMGIDWMTWDGLRECVPPAYTEYLGHQLADFLISERVA
jgi:Site-specific DNA methylase